MIKQGQLRTEILDECPDDFRDELSDWIHGIELKLAKALDYLEINGIEELHLIEEAQKAIKEIKDGLY